MNLRGSFARSKSETLEAITDATNIGGQVKVQADDAANKLEILADWILGSNLNPDKIDQAAKDALESFNKVLKIIV
jgi:predicted Zn-dependent peptidase